MLKYEAEKKPTQNTVASPCWDTVCVFEQGAGEGDEMAEFSESSIKLAMTTELNATHQGWMNWVPFPTCWLPLHSSALPTGI